MFVPLTPVVSCLSDDRSRARMPIDQLTFLAGIALLVLPGPGWLLIFIGLTILATEYVWAQRLLNAAKRKAEQAKAAVLRKKDSGGSPSS